MSQGNVITVNGKAFVRCGAGSKPEVSGMLVSEGAVGYFNVIKQGIRLFNRAGRLSGFIDVDSLCINSSFVDVGGREVRLGLTGWTLRRMLDVRGEWSPRRQWGIAAQVFEALGIEVVAP